MCIWLCRFMCLLYKKKTCLCSHGHVLYKYDVIWTSWSYQSPHSNRDNSVFPVLIRSVWLGWHLINKLVYLHREDKQPMVYRRWDNSSAEKPDFVMSVKLFRVNLVEIFPTNNFHYTSAIILSDLSHPFVSSSQLTPHNRLTENPGKRAEHLVLLSNTRDNWLNVEFWGQF